MDESSKLGLNRTGAQMAPLNTRAMREEADRLGADPAQGDAMAAAAMRGQYTEESGTVGSVPVPGTVTGVLKTGMQKLMGRAPEAFVDKLGERLAFERTGVRLYEALIVKCQALQGTQNELPLMDLRKYRDDEARHFKLVERALEKLGADPTAQTPSADMAATAGMGVLQVISDPRSTIPQALNALLTAELTDNAGWELLIKLAREHGEDDMANDFEQALQSETLHAGEVKRWLEVQVLEPA